MIPKFSITTIAGEEKIIVHTVARYRRGEMMLVMMLEFAQDMPCDNGCYSSD
ncbi:hypothetical protein CBL_10737 [Carabus blaptoides fortunei]